MNACPVLITDLRRAPTALSADLLLKPPDIISSSITYYKQAFGILHSQTPEMHFEIGSISFINSHASMYYTILYKYQSETRTLCGL